MQFNQECMTIIETLPIIILKKEITGRSTVLILHVEIKKGSSSCYKKSRKNNTVRWVKQYCWKKQGYVMFSCTDCSIRSGLYRPINWTITRQGTPFNQLTLMGLATLE
jgi:hypothetical protein